MRYILSDFSKFSQVSVTDGKIELNFIVNIEKHIADLFKELKNLKLFL